MKDTVSLSLPDPAAASTTLARHYCREFLHALHRRSGGSARRQINRHVLEAIADTARLSGTTPETVAATLVDLGLRADAAALPENFVTGLLQAGDGPGWRLGAASAQHRQLASGWKKSPVKGYTRRPRGTV